MPERIAVDGRDPVCPHQALLRPRADEPYPPPADWKPYGALARDWEKILRQAMNSGEFCPDLDVKMVSYGMLNWAYEWYKPGGRLGFREAAFHKAGPGRVAAVGSRNKLASERKNRTGAPRTEDCRDVSD
jgi:hypothetical protein